MSRIAFSITGQSTTDALWYYVYKFLLVFWIMFGLGYLVMILGFISRAMRCKKMARLERKLAQNLKHTHSIILNEFNKDVSYIRRLLNELYLSKYKVSTIVCLLTKIVPFFFNGGGAILSFMIPILRN